MTIKRNIKNLLLAISCLSVIVWISIQTFGLGILMSKDSDVTFFFKRDNYFLVGQKKIGSIRYDVGICSPEESGIEESESIGFLDMRVVMEDQKGSIVKAISESESEFNSLTKYLEYDILKDCILISDGDTLHPLGHIWENLLVGELRFRIFFEHRNITELNKKNRIHFVCNDKLFDLGLVKIQLKN